MHVFHCSQTITASLSATGVYSQLLLMMICIMHGGIGNDNE